MFITLRRCAESLMFITLRLCAESLMFITLRRCAEPLMFITLRRCAEPLMFITLRRCAERMLQPTSLKVTVTLKASNLIWRRHMFLISKTAGQCNCYLMLKCQYTLYTWSTINRIYTCTCRFYH